jgi:hypothetical protein
MNPRQSQLRYRSSQCRQSCDIQPDQVENFLTCLGGFCSQIGSTVRRLEHEQTSDMVLDAAIQPSERAQHAPDTVLRVTRAPGVEHRDERHLFAALSQHLSISNATLPPKEAPAR